MEKSYKNCQSCGMPKTKDVKGGGTNVDGTKSAMYCSLCFEHGQFCQPNLTAKEMQIFVKGELKELRIPGFMSWLMTINIPKLERWRK